MIRLTLVCLSLWLIAGFVSAGTIYVDDDALPGGDGSSGRPYQFIQDGIDAAVGGDTVLVKDGIYSVSKGARNVNLNFFGKAITVKSENGPANCIIDCENVDDTRGFYFQNGEDSDSVIDGFTIRNSKEGENTYYGGGIGCMYSSPTIMNNIITGNSAYYGGGIGFYESSPTIMNNIITGNSAFYGGGIRCVGDSSPVIDNNIIMRNSATYWAGGIECSSFATITNNIINDNRAEWQGGGIRCVSSAAMISNNIIVGNSAGSQGGGIDCYSSSSPMIISNTITGNSAGGGGGGINCYDNSSPTVINTILWNNSPQEIAFTGFLAPNTITISYSDVQAGETGIVTNNNGAVNWLDGNIDADPLFVNAANGDYHLSDDSPCIGAGFMAPDVPTTDIEGNPRPRPLGSNPDIGAYENPLGVSGGSIVIMVNNTPSGVWSLRPPKMDNNGPDITAERIMQVPNGWVLRLVNKHQNTVKVHAPNGQEYIWWEVKNPGNGVTGWMASEKSDGSEVYLVPPGNYSGKWVEVEEIDREKEIIEVVMHYYNASNSAEPRLYSSVYVSDLKDHFPIELVLGIAAVESGFIKSDICGGPINDKFNNEVYGDDGALANQPDPVSGGVGIMQITKPANRGFGSGLKCYPETGELAYKALESSLSPYPTCGYTKHQYYTNTSQGIYANIKDSLYIIRQKYDGVANCVEFVDPFTGVIVTEQEMKEISTVQRYNIYTREPLFTFEPDSSFQGKMMEYYKAAKGVPEILRQEFEDPNHQFPLSAVAQIVKQAEYTDGWGWRISSPPYIYYSVIQIEESPPKYEVIKRGTPGVYIERVKDRLVDIRSKVFFPDFDFVPENLDKIITNFETVLNNSELISLGSPGELRVYDSNGHVTGSINGEPMEEAANSAYDETEKVITVFLPSDPYLYAVMGVSEGNYALGITSIRNGDIATFTAADIPTSSGENHQYMVDWDILSQGGDGVTVQIDFNGDNTFELIITTGSSFLSTLATIDFDPDTLNLTSGRKWGTCYIELPEDYNVEEIAPETVRLWIGSNSILAEDKPFTVGDYDVDGIPDLMVKFSGEAIIGFLQGVGITTGDVTLTFNGRVGSSMFEGTDTIRIVGATDGTIDEGRAPNRPTEFALYQNFSNPFNPDTWIPYQLAEDVYITVRIYDISSKLIRTLNLGHKPAGFYTDKSKAAYWDGKNESGEQVSSGVYFYTIQAGDFTATKKMVVAK